MYVLSTCYDVRLLQRVVSAGASKVGIYGACRNVPDPVFQRQSNRQARKIGTDVGAALSEEGIAGCGNAQLCPRLS